MAYNITVSGTETSGPDASGYRYRTPIQEACSINTFLTTVITDRWAASFVFECGSPILFPPTLQGQTDEASRRWAAATERLRREREESRKDFSDDFNKAVDGLADTKKPDSQTEKLTMQQNGARMLILLKNPEVALMAKALVVDRVMNSLRKKQ